MNPWNCDNSYDKGTASDGWLTPPHVLAELGHFDLDPCTPENMPWKTADRRYTKNDDGLLQPWEGRVWCNPPYGTETARWLAKCVQHGNAIALIYARTETLFFQEYVLEKADAVFFFKGRLRFCDGNGKGAKFKAGAPSCLVAYGENNAKTLQTYSLPGKCLLINKNSNNICDEGKMKYQCLGKNIVVLPDPPEEKTQGGLIIPEVGRERSRRGTVKYIGTGVEFQNGTVRPLLVQIGDRVLFGEYAGVALTVDGEECLYMREDEIVLKEMEG
jgi:co-chaperonin GroES (HSP10)